MPRSDEAAAWFSAVYSAVREIPPGRVTSYGHIAYLLGKPQCPRQVGVCLKHLPSASDDNPYHDDNVPWQRVINSKGGISPRGPSGASRQADALRQEGVQVQQGSLGEFFIDFATYGWFPDTLPSDDAEFSGSDANASAETEADGV
ncbi:MGMT family protein [Viridothelium virens]|uniref:MGMT family protein n=1 Tax=Viridothelium virens TaxID=1048519 RepID=A0A6A6HDG2_VIRVR|nr:MGMT family protein [Viridothelium virens]